MEDKRKPLSGGSNSPLIPFAAGSGSDDPDDDPHKPKKRKLPRKCETTGIGIGIDTVRHKVFEILNQAKYRDLLQSLPGLNRTQSWNNAILEALTEEGRGSNLVSMALDLYEKGPESDSFRRILARATLRKWVALYFLAKFLSVLLLSKLAVALGYAFFNELEQAIKPFLSSGGLEFTMEKLAQKLEALQKNNNPDFFDRLVQMRKDFLLYGSWNAVNGHWGALFAAP